MMQKGTVMVRIRSFDLLIWGGVAIAAGVLVVTNWGALPFVQLCMILLVAFLVTAIVQVLTTKPTGFIRRFSRIQGGVVAILVVATLCALLGWWSAR